MIAHAAIEIRHCARCTTSAWPPVSAGQRRSSTDVSLTAGPDLSPQGAYRGVSLRSAFLELDAQRHNRLLQGEAAIRQRAMATHSSSTTPPQLVVRALTLATACAKMHGGDGSTRCPHFAGRAHRMGLIGMTSTNAALLLYIRPGTGAHR